MTLMRAIAMTLVLTVSGLTLAPAAPAQTAGANGTGESEPPSEWGINAAAWLASLPYGAAKVTYAILGGTVGALTFAFSAGDKDAAMAVWTTSMGGTYIITPDHLKGREPVRFLGGHANEAQAGASSTTTR